MQNSSADVLFFVLQGLNDTKWNKQIYFGISLLAFLLTIVVNLTLIGTIMIEKTLHEPMYLFVCNLCLNGLFGATSFYPQLLVVLQAESQIISYGACLTQIFAVFTHLLCDFIMLAVMAYDRYVAICQPLVYNAVMTPQRVAMLLLLTWLLPAGEIFGGVMLTARLPLCGNIVDKLYCANWEVVRLSCTDTAANNIYGYTIVVTHVCNAALILASYSAIVRVSVRSRTERAKFMQTCLPHVLVLLNFTVSLCFDVVYSRYNTAGNMKTLRNLIAVEYLTVPPLLNPLIYGLRLSQIRQSIVRRLHRQVTALQ